MTHIGTPGTIDPVGSEVQFQGNGTYTVKVSLGAGSGGATDCLSGPSTTGSFTVAVRVAPKLVGDAARLPRRPPRGRPVRRSAAARRPAGRRPGARATRRSSRTGRSPERRIIDGDISRSNFPEPGAWTCVARGFAEGQDESFDTARFGTPWSAPLPFVVHSDFRRARGVLARRRSKRPRLTFIAEFPSAATGGAATFKPCGGSSAGRDTASCRRSSRPGAAASTPAAGSRSSTRRPRKPGYFLGHLTFAAGSSLYRAGTHLLPVLLWVDELGRFDWASPTAFPSC